MCMLDQPGLHHAQLTVPEAIRWCAQNSGCAGFSIPEPALSACAANASTTLARDVHFKAVGCSRGHPYDPPAANWSTWSKPGVSWVSYRPDAQYAAWKVRTRPFCAI